MLNMISTGVMKYLLEYRESFEIKTRKPKNLLVWSFIQQRYLVKKSFLLLGQWMENLLIQNYVVPIKSLIILSLLKLSIFFTRFMIYDTCHFYLDMLSPLNVVTMVYDFFICNSFSFIFS